MRVNDKELDYISGDPSWRGPPRVVELIADLRDLRAAAREFFKAEDDYGKVGPQDPLGEWDTGDVEAQMEAAEVVRQKKEHLRSLLDEDAGKGDA